MSIEKLKRVCWRLESLAARTGQVSFSLSELRKAVYFECGTDPKTWHSNRKALTNLGWILQKKRGTD